MASNEHCSAKATATTADLVAYHLYFWEGLVIVVVNLALLVVILLSPRIRCQKEYMLYAGCIAFDAIFGFTYFIAAVYRFHIFFTNIYFPLATMWGCVTTPHIICFVYITPGAGILVFTCSIDRFLGVFFPFKYVRFTTRYVWMLLAIAFSIPVLMFGAALITSSPHNFVYNQLATCITEQAVTPTMYLILRLTRIICSCSSGVIYIPIAIRIFSNVHAMSRSQFSSGSTRRLLRTTLTIVLVTFNTILMYAAPDIILLINPKTTSNFFFILNLNKGVINIVIFFATQKTLRDACWSVVKGKSLQAIGAKVGSASRAEPSGGVEKLRATGTSVRAIPVLPTRWALKPTVF